MKTILIHRNSNKLLKKTRICSTCPFKLQQQATCDGRQRGLLLARRRTNANTLGLYLAIVRHTSGHFSYVRPSLEKDRRSAIGTHCSISHKVLCPFKAYQPIQTCEVRHFHRLLLIPKRSDRFQIRMVRQGWRSYFLHSVATQQQQRQKETQILSIPSFHLDNLLISYLISLQ